MPEATVNGVRLAYDVHGSGDPLVLVCGLGQPAFSWEVSILPGLVAAGFRVITFDLRGMAPSAAPAGPYSVAQMADDTAALIEHLDLGPCVVAGYSLGSWVCEVLAAGRPELVRAAGFIAGLNQTTEWEKVECEYGRDLAALDVPLPKLQGLFDILVYPQRALLQDDEQVRGFAAMFGSDPPWGNPGRLGQWEAAYAWTQEDETEAVARRNRISVPCVAIAFTDDIDSPPAHAQVAVAQVSGCRYVEIPDATHLGPFTHPADVVTALTTFTQHL